MYALESLLRCPKCHAAALAINPHPICDRCGWAGRESGDILDFVDPSRLVEQHHHELGAQTNAVRDYYENESKVSCHWDRISALELPEILARPTGLVLDVGCGTGSAGGAVRRSGATVIGADLSLECLRIARRRLDGVVRADAAMLPFQDGAFDAAVARGAFHHMADASAALAELARVLKPNAPALIVEPREFAWLEPLKHRLRRNDPAFTEHHHAYTIADLRGLVGDALRVEETFTLHPLGIMMAVGLDLLPLPAWLPKRPLARGLYALDQALDKTALRRGGHLVAIKARRTETLDA